MATLLFLGASVSQTAAIRRARELGHRVVAVDGDRHAVAFPLCDVAETVDFSDVDRVAEVARRHGAAAVLAISTDRAVVPAARVARLLGLPGVGVEVAVAMTNKAVMRTALQAAGVPQPAFRVVRGPADLAGEPIFPAVLKPSDSGGQRGVFLVRDVDEARDRLDEALRFTRNGVALLEEHVAGTEVNGLFAVRAGEPSLLTLSDRLRPEGAGFGVGWAHAYPSALPDETLERVRQVAEDAIRALGLRDGIAFPQLIAAPDGSVRVVEVAARIAAGQMADLVMLGTGIDVFRVAFALALGEPVPDGAVEPRFRRPIAIRFLTAAPGVLPVGEVTAVEGLERVRAAEGVLAADLYFAAGARLRPVQVDADRSGYVIATAETPVRALELADRASALLTVHTRQARRRRRLPELALVAAALVGVAVALAVGERGKLHHALVTATRVDARLSPACRCPHDVAHIAFRLLHAGPVGVAIVNAVGRTVDTLRADAPARPGPEALVWRGTNARGGRVPDGVYRPEINFPRLHRTVVLPHSIVVEAG